MHGRYLLTVTTFIIVIIIIIIQYDVKSIRVSNPKSFLSHVTAEISVSKPWEKKSMKSLIPQWGLGNESLMLLFSITQGIRIHTHELLLLWSGLTQSETWGSAPGSKVYYLRSECPWQHRKRIREQNVCKTGTRFQNG